MNSIKLERYNKEFVRVLSEILMEEVKDDDIKFVTITDVDITNDLSYAKVYFTVLDKNKIDTTLNALNKASSFIRGKVSERVEIRHTPELKFVHDTSIEYGERIEEVLDQIQSQTPKDEGTKELEEQE